MQHQHPVHPHPVHPPSHLAHQYPTKAICVATLSVFLLAVGCGKSDSIASSADPSTSVSPVTTEVSTEVSNAEISNAEISNAEPITTTDAPSSTSTSTSNELEPAIETADVVSEESPTAIESAESAETIESVPSQAQGSEGDEQFFRVLESAMNDEDKVIHQAVGQEKALQLAQAACQNFDQGKSFNQIANDVVGGLQASGLEGEELQKTAYYSGKVMGVGVAVFCPQYRSQIEAENG